MRRVAPTRDLPPPLELECLKALWILGEGNVRQVQQALNPTRNLAYTTVMTILERLGRRGGVARRKRGRSFVYSPVLTRESVRRTAVKELVETFFDGSEESLRAYLSARVKSAAASADTGEARMDAALL
ncbi:MAG: BlaI/MecI/CopY family transcriptional regulator [Acidobacteria bacterium]|nr:BlaI/MecI/CopY family transcriptional regulator [Acidobacteriota bacterium]MBI3281114.1 BlaI/MecI/CopY family transcriptional regulator [Acidobacteriota bacterium]